LAESSCAALWLCSDENRGSADVKARIAPDSGVTNGICLPSVSAPATALA